MSDNGVSPQGVIEDLAEQVKRLSVDNAVLRTAIKEIQQAQVSSAPVPDGPPAEAVYQMDAETAENLMTVFDGGDPTTEPMPED